MKRSITRSIISIVVLLSSISFGSPNLAGQYWFGSLSVDVDTNAPLAKRGTVSVIDNQWHQKWEDYNGKHEFSSTFTTTLQPDCSININFEEETNAGETYNVAWNGNVMIHAGSVLHVGGEGIDFFTRQATNVDVNDVLGDYGFFAHHLEPLPWTGDSCGWGNFQIESNGAATGTWTNDRGDIESATMDWTIDDMNATVGVFGPTIGDLGYATLFLGDGGIGCTWQIIPEEGRNDFGYGILIKRTDQVITMAEIAGTYQFRFLETGPGGVPYTCNRGTCVIEAVDDANGTLSLDAHFSNGLHDISHHDCAVGPGNEFHVDDDGVPDGIISLDKNLIFAPEYRYKNPPTRTEDDWIGGIFLTRIPNNVIDPNGWVYETPMNVARDQFAGGVINGKIYVFGGNGNPDGQNLNSTEVYDPATMQWRMLADNNHSDWGIEELTSAVVDDKFYIFGVYGDFGFNEMYDPVTNEWTTLAKKPTKVAAEPTTVYENEIYIFGGYSDSDDPSQDSFIYQGIESYNPSTNTWRYVTDMPLPIADFGIATVGTKAYLFGGNTNKPDRQFFDDVITYDFETGEWIMTGYQQMPVKKRFMYSNSAPVIEGKVYLIGTMREDIDGQFVLCDRVDIYDPTTNTWHEGPSLPHPLDGHVTLAIGEKIYLIGGLINYDLENRAKSEVISLDTNFCSP